MAGLVAELLDPALTADAVIADLRRLAAARPVDLEPWTYLARLGFAGNRDDYEALDNSNLARVLTSRRGIPITLGVVLIEVARAADRRAIGINFPGHFLVQVDDVLVDPFVLEPITPEAVQARLPDESRGLPSRALFAEASPVAVGVRMLNNVKLVFTRQSAWHRALDVLDAQLALAPQQPALHIERGDLWRRLGVVVPAREAYERALDLVSGTDSDQAEQARRSVKARIDELGGSDDTVH